MSRPIERTPVLEGEDAEALLRDISETASPEEIKRRVAHARAVREELMRRKEALKR
jgi:hypothetical protein